MISSINEPQTLRNYLRRALEKFRRARNEFQIQLHPLDLRRTALVLAATRVRRLKLSPRLPHRRLDEMAGRDVDGSEPFRSADFPGIFSGQLREAFRTHPHRQTRFHAASSDEHAIFNFTAASRS